MFITNINHANADSIVWKNITITKTTHEEDIRTLLSDFLEKNGNNVFFGPDVEGKVTFEFSDLPIRFAVKKILEEHNLFYMYEPITKTVSIYHKNPPVTDIYIPKFSKINTITTTLGRHGLLNNSVVVKSDVLTNSIYLHGKKDKVDKLKTIINNIDDAVRIKAEKEIEAKRLLEDKERQKKKLIQTNLIVEVIPLQYANVGTTTSTFQGEEVTAPGIIESLKAFTVYFKKETKSDSDTKKDATDKEISQNQEEPEGTPRITKDLRTNSIIVQGTVEQVNNIKEVISKLDRPVPLIEIEVMIIDGVANLSEQLGVQWGINSNITNSASTLEPASNIVTTGVLNQIAINPSDSTTSSTSDSTVVQLASTVGGFGGGFIYQGDRTVLDATLNALAADNKLQTIASPKIVTINNQEAKISNTNNINFVLTTDEGNRADIQTVSTGVNLNITPSVILSKNGGKDSVRLEINAGNSTLGAIEVTSVLTDNQEILTSVVIPEETTFIIGGLFNTSRVEGESGIPFFKDIPYLGRLFKTNTSHEQKRETIFFITPKIIRQDEIKMDLSGRQMKEYMDIKKYNYEKDKQTIQNKSPLIKFPKDSFEDEG
ncbi:MAG: hypothetical protein HQL69_24190 [Magnetococcales bacterium]|nr:hypothetical protein [Magnetococcales bacterium]